MVESQMKPLYIKAALKLTVCNAPHVQGMLVGESYIVNKAGDRAPYVAAASLAFKYLWMYFDAKRATDGITAEEVQQHMDALVKEIQRIRDSIYQVPDDD
jgi:hypothetical protein